LGLRPERIDTAAKSVRPNRCQVEIGARWKSVPGTCPRRGDASNLRGGLEVGARHLSKDARHLSQDAAGC